MKYEDLQPFESEKKSQGPPPLRAFLQRLCSGPFPLLLSLGFSLFLLVDICIIGSKNAKIQRDLETLRATFSNFTSNTVTEVSALHSQDGSLQETIASLKAVVENQEQELQAAHSLNDKVASLESKLEKEQQELQAGQAPPSLHLGLMWREGMEGPRLGLCFVPSALCVSQVILKCACESSN